jgi:hypothetical protein
MFLETKNLRHRTAKLRPRMASLMTRQLIADLTTVAIKDGPTNSPLFPFVTQPQPFYQRKEEEKEKR